jgi:hypothetical protein
MEQQQERKLDCFVARAPLRKRFALSQAMTNANSKHSFAISPRVSREFLP